MAAVLAGLTVLQLAQLVEALAGAAASGIKIHQTLEAKGFKPTDKIPPEHAAQVHALIAQTASALTQAGLTPSQQQAMANIATMGVQIE